MIKIESLTLEEAYSDAASSLKCSVTELNIEVVQYPKKGILGLFKKSAIIVAVKKEKENKPEEKLKQSSTNNQAVKKDESIKQEEAPKQKRSIKKEKVKEKAKEKIEPKTHTKVRNESHTILNDTIMPASFVSTQDDEDDTNYEPVYADENYDEDEESYTDIIDIASNIKKEINSLFDLTCFEIDKIEVSVYDSNTILIEFKGDDAALLIGKEGYRYKALSYMIFNWINTKYQVQLRLEIAEFLKNQEESVSRYLQGVCEGVDRDGRAQTKILDGVLVQIALKELRDIYPDKYVAIRSTRDGLKYIIINDYHNN